MAGAYLALRPHAMILYHPARYSDKVKQGAGLRRLSPEGKLSENSRRKMLSCIRWMVAVASGKQVYEKSQKRMVDWKINMATLTFKENMQDDNKARRILSSWLEVAKYRWAVNNYLWKAEPQSRGAIHFHLSTDVYIPYRELRYTWNRALTKAGLSQVGSNSTDVHAVESVNNLEAYLTEYLLNDKKHEGRRLIKGRLWGASHGLSAASECRVFIPEDEIIELEHSMSKYDLRVQYLNEGKPIPEWLEHVSYYKLPSDYWQKLQDCEAKQEYMKTIASLQPLGHPQLW